MKKILVTYKSKTGFVKYYAEVISNTLKCDLREWDALDKAELSGYDTVIYGGGLYAGVINGLSKAKKAVKDRGVRRLIIFATGATPNSREEIVRKMWDQNLPGEEKHETAHFYMQGGLNYEKMGFWNRKAMSWAAKLMDKDLKDGEHSLMSSFDIQDAELCRPLCQYVLDDQAEEN